MEKNRGPWLIAIYILAAVYLLPMFPHGGSSNELTRWATAASLVEKSSFEISWTEDLIGKNVDTATIGDKTYSNKPPGTAVLAAPFYALTRVFIGEPDASNIRISWFVMRFFISTMPLLFLALWLYGRNADEVSLGTVLFATPLFLYSILLFSHVLVAVLLYFAFRLLFDSKMPSKRSCFLAGLLSGLAVVCEFPVLVCVLVFAIGLMFTKTRDRRQNIFFFVIGGIPFAILLLIYNYALFGSPFSLSYAYESFPEWAEVAGQGVFGIGVPTFSNFYLLLFSPARGIFFFTPIFILSVIAFFTSREENILRHRIKIAAIVVSIVVFAGHGAVHGGWAFGARYLVFIIPLLLDSFFDGEIYDFPNLWQGFLYTISMLFAMIPALSFPFAPPEFTFPHNDFWGKFLIVENWFTPNLANVFGISSTVWSILPVIFVILAALYVVWSSARQPARFLLGVVAGFIVVGIYVYLPNLDNSENRFRRATIAERFFKPDDRMEEFKAPDANQSLERVNKFEWDIANSRAFAPDDFPYSDVGKLPESPARKIIQAMEFQNQGNLEKAEELLLEAKEIFPFGRCIISTNLAVVYYTANKKREAIIELESIQNLVGPDSVPACLRSQFLLGSLYREVGESDKANAAFRSFLSNSERSKDKEIIGFRGQLGEK